MQILVRYWGIRVRADQASVGSWTGRPSHREGEIQTVVSARLLDELREVLARPKFASDFTVEQAQALLQGLADCAELVTDPDTPRVRPEIPRTTISSRWHVR